MKILVTGGSGFIGTALVADLLEENHDVHIYDKHPSAKYPERYIHGDVRDRETLRRSLKDMEAVYHLAAEHRDDVQPISLYYDVNVGGAQNLIHACERNSVNKIIFTSTVALYGLNVSEPDEESPALPFNDYGKSKHESEEVFNAWANADRARSLTIVRPSVIFGEGNKGNVYNLIRQIATGKFIMVGNGDNYKSMGYVLNISRFLSTLTNAPPGKNIYNYADKPDLSSEELIKTVHQALGMEPEIKFRIPYRLGLAGGYVFDFLSKLTGRQYPISSIRVKKFCSGTRISAEKVHKNGFTAPYGLDEGLNRFIANDFL